MSELSRRVRALIQDAETGAIAEHPPPAAAGNLFDDAEARKIGKSGIDGGDRESGTLNGKGCGDERGVLQKFMNEECRIGTVAFRNDALPVRLEQIDDAHGGIEGPIGCFRHAVEKKFEPCFS